MIEIKSRLPLLLFMLAVPFCMKANMIWPSLYIVESYYVWYIIAMALVIEFFGAKFFLKTGWWKTLLIALTMNAISALIGLILIPLSGIFCELLLMPFDPGTFRLSHWIADYILAVLSNVCIEGAVLKLIFKYSFKKNFWWLLGANAISVIISVANTLF